MLQVGIEDTDRMCDLLMVIKQNHMKNKGKIKELDIIINCVVYTLFAVLLIIMYEEGFYAKLH